jgi:beta-glucanase (GH16 family)
MPLRPATAPASRVFGKLILGALALFATGIAAGSTSSAPRTATAMFAVEAPVTKDRRCPRRQSARTPVCLSVDPSGKRAPVGDISGWRQVFVDDFAKRVRLGDFGPATSPRWRPYPYPWKDTSKNGTYWPQKGLSVHDGVLDIWLHTETVNSAATHIVNAPQPVLRSVSRGQLYGRYAIRFKADPVPGYKTAWLLWPDSGERREGEIDFPEGNLSEMIYAYLHPKEGSTQYAYPTGATYRSWHTAVIEWLADRCTFTLDGKVIGTATSGIPDTPMHWVIQTETELKGQAPVEAASGHVYIDWVAVYAPL